MENYIQIFVLIPLVGFILSLFIPKKNENFISWFSFSTVGLQLLLAIVFSVYWLFNHHHVIDLRGITVFESKDYSFYLDFYFDKITVVFLLIGALLTFMITVYSRYYLHREEGYKRFFNVILFFFSGFNIVIFSGNLETMFIGWEILGISSFLLIAFYRDRYLPVKNAVKVFSIYRIGDVGLILAMWLSHHLWHSNISFSALNNYGLVHEHLSSHTFVGALISLMIFVSAAAKSAQLPFSSWLPRAMEGPTPSSAIFYGSLSVHIGAFIMLRTFHFWEHQFSIRIFIAAVGLTTSIVATLTARVQSSVKSQIAYSSIAQIGLIFIEIAAGLEVFALIHIAGNAFLRTYQLLVSPSVVSYKIREQFYNFIPRHKTIEGSLPKKIENSLYLLSLKEWNLDSLMYRYLWNPLKRFGNKLSFLTFKTLFWIFAPMYVIGFVLMFFRSSLDPILVKYLPGVFAFVGLILVIKAFTERKSVRMSWILVILNHFWIAMAISFNEHFDFIHIVLYLIGVVVFGFIGFIAVLRLKRIEGKLDMNQFQGHIYEHPKIALVFLISCLGLAGFPITPTFVGEDLIFSHFHQDQIFLAFFVALSFIIDGLALIRIYARVFLGPHSKTYHQIAKRSS